MRRFEAITNAHTSGNGRRRECLTRNAVVIHFRRLRRIGVGDFVYIIGSLGYLGTRRLGETPVYRLDVHTLRMGCMDTRGEAPASMPRSFSFWAMVRRDSPRLWSLSIQATAFCSLAFSTRS